MGSLALQIKDPFQFVSSWYCEPAVWRCVRNCLVCQVNAEHFLSINFHWRLQCTCERWIVDPYCELASLEERVLKIYCWGFGWNLEWSFRLWQVRITIQNANILPWICRWYDQLTNALRHWWRFKLNTDKWLNTFEVIRARNCDSRCFNSEICSRNRNFSFRIDVNCLLLSNLFNSAIVNCLLLSIVNEFKLMSLFASEISFEI